MDATPAFFCRLWEIRMSNSRWVWLSVAAVLSTACGPAKTASTTEAQTTRAIETMADAPVPPPADADGTFKACTWGQVKSTTLSIWSYTCPTSRLVPDADAPGFVLEESGARHTALRVFKKPADAAITAILPAVRAASPGPHSDSCTLIPQKSDPEHFEFGPTGSAVAEWAASQDNGGKTPPPCGPLGPDFVGDRRFAVMPGEPTTVVYVDMGSEIQIFDPATLRIVK